MYHTLKKLFFLLLLFGLLLSVSFVHTSKANAQERINYLALGDSLAAGMTPYDQIGSSYTDLIAMGLKQSGSLAGFSKTFAIPGYTSGQLLGQLQDRNVQEAVKQADLITISSGANDLLQLIQKDPDHLTVRYQQIPVDFALNQLRLNEEEILSRIHRLNSHAKVFVMGYYFPFPHIAPDHKQGTAGELAILNKILEQSAERNGAVFVPVSNEFGLDAKSLIPNPSDVHPLETGYLKMANQFFRTYTNGRIALSASVLAHLPKPIPLTELIEKERQRQERQAGTAGAESQPVHITAPYVTQ
ncbi:SGNH/GDSL hydrolase family protein [Falsibacillus albus]|uniref:SGNH/GDSL hydrolase family protein n=1 Tax=Falsibacillus albus TaxID=2478915 RepID=A0A3L7JIL4_9BACI|nr:GDSL-type esterase/lipase family protein [Falsibacillus albus]RLQ90628.1 SGNH/GDSL hydrolase family protein [Falsibacillus albus]